MRELIDSLFSFAAMGSFAFDLFAHFIMRS